MKKLFLLLMIAIFFGLTVSVHATPVTYAELNFRTNDWPGDPYNANPVNISEYGTNFTSLSYTSGRGSTARFTSDAAAGTLRAFAYARNGIVGYAMGDNARAKGYVRDYFTLYGPPPGTPVNITAYFTLDGTLSGSSSAPYTLEAFENAYVATQFTSGSGNELFALWARTGTEMNDCWLSGCPGFSVPINRVDSINREVFAGTPFDIYYVLDALGGWAYNGSGGTADFGATGAISFDLPDGTWITSEGGFYQTTTAPIPEPSTLLLLGSGLAGLAALRRKFKVKN